ncbi:MAG: hypothetical protein Q9182_007421, partial [Xanthomendoza sp. 2 TL-2023]
MQILTNILCEQNDNGSWSSQHNTVCALCALVCISTLPHIGTMRKELRSAIDNGRGALATMLSGSRKILPYLTEPFQGSSSSDWSATALWGVPFLFRDEGTESQELSTKRTQKILEFVSFFSGREHLRNVPLWKIKASIIEALFYLPLLQAARKKVFQATATKEKDKYLDYISIMWLLANNCSGGNVGRTTPEFLLDMMILS